MNSLSLGARMVRGPLVTIFRWMKFSQMRMRLSRSSLCLRSTEESHTGVRECLRYLSQTLGRAPWQGGGRKIKIGSQGCCNCPSLKTFQGNWKVVSNFSWANWPLAWRQDAEPEAPGLPQHPGILDFSQHPDSEPHGIFGSGVMSSSSQFPSSLLPSDLISLPRCSRASLFCS